MSLNALAEYLAPATSHSRKWKILVEQKAARIFQTTYRRTALQAILKCLGAGGKDAAALDEGVRQLKAIHPRDDYDRDRRDNGLATIEAFRRCLRNETLRGMELTAARSKPMVIEGVTVSARPEAYVIRDGDIIGALKLSLSKSARIAGERAAYAGAILHQYVEADTGHPIDPASCIVIDVRNGAFTTAPVTFKKRRRDIAAALRAIFAMWPSVHVEAEDTPI